MISWLLKDKLLLHNIKYVLASVQYLFHIKKEKRKCLFDSSSIFSTLIKLFIKNPFKSTFFISFTCQTKNKGKKSQHFLGRNVVERSKYYVFSFYTPAESAHDPGIINLFQLVQLVATDLKECVYVVQKMLNNFPVDIHI